MSKQLYEEALADVKKLKEIAEDSAKKALIEAVSPRIRDLIEAELLREVNDEEKQDDLLVDDYLGNANEQMSSEISPEDLPVENPLVAAAISEPDEEGKVTLDLDDLHVEPAELEFELSNESIKLLNPIVKKINAVTILKIESKLFRFNETMQQFMEASAPVKKTVNFQHQVLGMVSEIENVYEYLQESASNLQDKGVYEGKLEQLYKQLNKLVEQYNMKNNLKSLLEADLTLKLTNMPEDLSLEDLGVDIVSDDDADTDDDADDDAESVDDADADADAENVDDDSEEPSEDGLDLDLDSEEEEDEDEEKAEESHTMDVMESKYLRNNTVVEIDEGMLRREISRMRNIREADETKPQSWGHGAGDLGDLEDEDLGDPLLDIELSEADDSEHAGAHEENLGEPEPEPDDMDMKEPMQTYEADESKQVQEIRRRLTREGQIRSGAQKKAQSAKLKQQEAQKKAKLKEQEAQKQAKQKKHLEAQKAKQEAQKQVKQAKKMHEAYVYYANIFNESVRRTASLQSALLAESRKVIRHNGVTTRSTAETSNLRKKLAETNLFNTKLLYCNKLLQNETLTKRQKADVIERLDEAKTEREVTLVYESLVKTLGRPVRALAEGTHRVLGSSSQVTRPASTFLSEGGEAERWAKLAGLK